MEGQPAKRRRVYSLEPNKVVQAAFARNYMNYLVPALIKIKDRTTSSEHRSHCDIHNVVKYEVDMAMVFSAQGFAWSNALSVKLQRDRVKVDSDTTSFDEKNKTGEDSSRICDQNEMVALDYFSSTPSLKNSKYKDIPEMKKGLRGEVDDDDEIISGQLRSLRRLIPGGEEMCNEQMVAELESYISCLQMQVNILQCLAETR
ncbi:transcription factor bHLH146-like [Abrus precatorius]|uniref:Transcription factor bHLH146-like n=1 Tax=Abrus precatorius TaxID=3816 RepID=A0A8B8K3K9_ABRPR|nr:transcription factor bHLH146-like [Abrus precatorius]